MHTQIVVISVLFALAIPLGSGAGEMVEFCEGCHGTDGVSQWSDVPTIAGISDFVHEEALFLYQDGARPCRESEFRQGDTNRAATDMCVTVQGMNEAEIAEIAAHFADIPFIAARQEFDAGLVEIGKTVHDSKCEKCHTNGGANPADDSSVLAGQWAEYLRQSFADYRDGERDQTEKMQVKMDKLSDEDVEALIHYYASQQ